MGQPDKQDQLHQNPVTIDPQSPPPPVDEQDYNKPSPPQPFPPPPQQFPPMQDDNNNNNVQHFPPPPLPQPTEANNIEHFPPPQPQPQPQPAIGLLQPWKIELFDCMKNPQNALITLFFPCVTFGQIAEIVDAGSTSCTTSGMMYTVIPCFIATPYRTKMRNKFGLVESPAPDFVIHFFCECCALCQEYRELEERGIDPSIGWLGNVAKKKQQSGVTPPMQQRMF